MYKVTREGPQWHTHTTVNKVFFWQENFAILYFRVLILNIVILPEALFQYQYSRTIKHMKRQLNSLS